MIKKEYTFGVRGTGKSYDRAFKAVAVSQYVYKPIAYPLSQIIHDRR